MGCFRTGTVGYSYRNWIGPFYSKGTSLRRQIKLYLNYFDVCEISQFVHQMPNLDRVSRLENQLNSRHVKLYVRLHRALTQSADTSFAYTVAKHFRSSMQPLVEANKFGGFVASFPYAFRNTPQSQDYLLSLSAWLKTGDLPLQVDFRHHSWTTESAFQWLKKCNLAFVCVDEPDLPGLVRPHALATANRVLVRFHGRNAKGWWSGNPMSRYDYLYSEEELDALFERYEPLLSSGQNVDFVFQNHWQAQAAVNAISWKKRLEEYSAQNREDSFSFGTSMEDDSLRPPLSVPMSEIKERVSQALSTGENQLPLTLRPRDF